MRGPFSTPPVAWRELRDRFRCWTGIVLPRSGIALALDVLEESAAQVGESPLTYLTQLDDPGADAGRQLLIDRLVNRTSWFMRESAGVRALVQALRNVARRRRDPRVRLWSAGCSTGHEPYTLAMALRNARLQPEIIATDICEGALQVARAGVYPDEQLEILPRDWRDRYTGPYQPGKHRIAHALRQAIRYERHNLLLGDPLPAPWAELDAVVCRNVLIYFEREDALAILDRLASALLPSGYVLLGAVEQPLVWMTDQLIADDESEAILLRKPRPHEDAEAIFNSKRFKAIVRPREELVVSAPPRLELPPRARQPTPIKPVPTTAPPLSPERVRSLVGGRDAATDDMLEKLEQLAQDRPLDAGIHLLRGLALKSAGRVSAAIGAFRCSRFLSQNDAWMAPYQLGLCLEQRAELKAAREAYRHALIVLDAHGPSGLQADLGADDGLAATVAAACRARIAGLSPV